VKAILTIVGREPIEIKRPNQNNCVSYQCLEDYKDFVKTLEELIN